MPPENAIRFRVDPQTRRGLDRLRAEKAINVSAWVRRLVHQGLKKEFPDGEPDDALDEALGPRADRRAG